MNIQKKYTVGAIGLVLALASGLFYYTSISKGPIVDFVPERDTKEMLKIFYDDWYWLFPGPDYSPEFILKYKAPSKEPYEARYIGKLNINVLRDSGKVAGFTTYYKKNFYEGQVQFIAVSKEFRRKGYGRMLTEHAVGQLFKLGSKKVSLLTRLNNEKARRIYERIGFKETHRDDGFIFYSIRSNDFKLKDFKKEKN